MSNISRPADGLNSLSNGKLTAWSAGQFGFSPRGCAYRGTIYCLRCPWAKGVPIECNYLCARCEVRSLCPCGHDSQTVRVESWFRIGEFAEVTKMEDKNVGRLRRFQVRGELYLRWYCDCPDCNASHGQTFHVETTVLDTDEKRAIEQAIKGMSKNYDEVEWEDGPDVEELPLGEDERMRMAGAPELLTA